MESFTDDFLQFSNKTVKNGLLGDRLNASHQFQTFLGFS